MFLFSRTNHIPGIREDPEAGSPFYIKRLPFARDTLRIDPAVSPCEWQESRGLRF